MNESQDLSFDAALGRALHAGDEPAGDGFISRVVASLPAQAPQRAQRWSDWGLCAHWVAISVAACAGAALLDVGAGPLDSPQQCAAYTLLGLLSLWSVPSWWSRA
jgi:hypothetical protein